MTKDLSRSLSPAMGKKKAIGARGSWFAAVDGELLPCVHSYYWQSPARYHDPDLQDTPKAVELVKAIQEKRRVILTKDNPVFDDFDRVTFQRTAYVAVFSVGGVEFDSSGLRFTFLKRVEDLQ